MSESKKIKIQKQEKYYEATGRRKRAVARVRIITCNSSQSIGEGQFLVNDKSYKEYFPIVFLQQTVESPFQKLKLMDKFSGTAKVKGGGINGQAEAIRHGISRAMIVFDANFRKKLKKSGYLTRDPREKERRKFGLRKARRAPQWSKR